MTDDKELIARLHNLHAMLEEEGYYTKANTASFAADRIEALTKERDQWISHAKNAIWADSEELKEAEAYAEELERELNTCRMAQAVMDNTVADLEGKLAKAAEALQNVIGEYDLFRKDEYERGLAPLDDEIHEARATLAEIKGESHD